MPIKAIVNKATFARVVSGEQTEIYVPIVFHWTHLLKNPRTGRFYRNQTLLISTRRVNPELLIAARISEVEVSIGKSEWGVKTNQEVYRISFVKPALLHPPFHPLLFRPSLRNRIK